MKVFIWLFCFFVVAVIQTAAREAGVILGAIPTVLLYSLAWWAAKKLCDRWDQRQAEKAALAASESPAPDALSAKPKPTITDPAEPVYLMETEAGELVRVPASRFTAWTTAQKEGSGAGNSKLKQRVEERVLRTMLGEQASESPAPEELPVPQPEPEPNIADPSAPAPRTPKLRFCKHCGRPIDLTTRKCSGCGKQYFRPPVVPKLSPFVIATSLVCILLAVLSLNLNAHLNAAEAKIEELNAQVELLNADLAVQEDLANRYIKTASSYKSDLNSLQKRYDELNSKNAVLSKENASMSYEIAFYDRHVVFVSDDGTKKYHNYSCEYLDLSYFWAYNKEAAEDRGYKPCSHCCG